MRWRAALAIPVFLLAFAGSAQAAAGPVASRIEELFWVITAFAIGVSVVVYGALFWFLIRYRRSVSPIAEPIEGDRRLETAWTVVPTIILVIITAISFPVLLYTDTPPPHDYTVVIRSERFSWSFDYYENDNLARATPDASTRGELWIQAGSVVRLEVTSRDVIHSFAVPELAVKIDALPQRVNVWWLQADEPGEYLTQCAEFCGQGHYGMRATIHVFTAGQRQQEAAEAGVPPKPYGPPPTPPEITEVRMQETGNVTRPFRIVPNRLEYRLGQNVTLRVWNEASQPYDFRIDIAMEGLNQSQSIPPFENRTITFTLNTTATADVPFGPTNAAARADGMVGNLTIRSGRLIVIRFLETGCPPPKTFCLVTDQDPLRIEKGEPVMFELRTEGVSIHNFQMDYPEFEVFYGTPINAGDPPVFFGPFTFNEDASGKYWCDIAGHRGLGMEGDYIVGAGSAPQGVVPVFDMMVITAAIGVPATFAFIFRHARRRDEEGSG